jgi:hypothetical protein
VDFLTVGFVCVARGVLLGRATKSAQVERCYAGMKCMLLLILTLHQLPDGKLIRCRDVFEKHTLWYLGDTNPIFPLELIGERVAVGVWGRCSFDDVDYGRWLETVPGIAYWV